MTEKEQIELFARAYNTMQEIVRTFYNEWVQKENIKTIEKALEGLDENINESENYTQQEKDLFLKLTDRLQDRIYFNCYKPWENERQ